MPAKPLSEITSSLFPEFSQTFPDSGDGRRPRARDRAAQWRVDKAREYSYAASRAQSGQEAEALATQYEQALEDGPDFTRYRRDSDFAPPPKITMDRNALARLRFKLHAIYKGSWKHKAKGKHAGVIQRTTLAVFDALCGLAGKHGQVFPSLEGLAYLAKCCKNTVIAALKELEFYGFVTVHRRLKRVRTALGFKTEQDTNAYSLHEPNSWGQNALKLFGNLFSGGAESNKWAARNPESLNSKDRGRNSPPSGPPQGSWGHLREVWDAS